MSCENGRFNGATQTPLELLFLQTANGSGGFIAVMNV